MYKKKQCILFPKQTICTCTSGIVKTVEHSQNERNKTVEAAQTNKTPDTAKTRPKYYQIVFRLLKIVTL